MVIEPVKTTAKLIIADLKNNNENHNKNNYIPEANCTCSL
jgi:hypothetical protein